jgi:hypothetical protein
MRVEDAFARFAEDFAGSFRPVPVEAMPRWRRARRRGGLWLAGLGAALAAAVSVNALQPVGGPGERPVVTDRVVRLDGGRGSMQVRFADRSHGWVLFSDCQAMSVCTSVLGRSGDGGRTWSRAELPPLPQRGQPLLVVNGPDELLIGASSPSEAWWTTSDGGRTYQKVDATAESLFARPGPETVAGADGTSWRLTHDGADTLVSYSPYAGATWRDLRPEVGADTALRRSPDGRDVWAVAGQPTRVWRLTPDGPVAEAGFPITADPVQVLSVGDGGLLILVPGPGLGVWRGGHFRPLPVQLSGALLGAVLGDGAIALITPDGDLLLGGEHEQWVRYVQG